MPVVELNYQRDPATGQTLFDSNGYPLIVPDLTANTFADVYNRVLYEVLGPATVTDAKNAVTDAIKDFETEVFWWNEFRFFGPLTGSASSLQTAIGKEFYSSQDLASLTNMPHIRQIMVLAFNNRYPLRLRSQRWIDDQSVSLTWQGLPTDWCWVGNAIRIYPVPNQVYPLILEGTIRFPPLINDTDYNPWTNVGERLVRARAKQLIFQNIARDQGQADAMEIQIQGDPRTGHAGYLGRARRQTQRRQGGQGRLRPSRGWM